MGVLRINGKSFTATHFAWDGCHKIYLISSTSDMAQMITYGYGEGDSEILPVSELPRVWEETCSLRFISPADLIGDDIVPQCYEDEPVIEWVA